MAPGHSPLFLTNSTSSCRLAGNAQRFSGHSTFPKGSRKKTSWPKCTAPTLVVTKGRNKQKQSKKWMPPSVLDIRQILCHSQFILIHLDNFLIPPSSLISLKNWLNPNERVPCQVPTLDYFVIHFRNTAPKCNQISHPFSLKYSQIR